MTKGVDLFSHFFFPSPKNTNVDKILSQTKKKKRKEKWASPLLQIQTVLVGGSNERRGLADTINIAQVLNMDVFAYECPFPMSPNIHSSRDCRHLAPTQLFNL